MRFNVPPSWPPVPPGWAPGPQLGPDPSWPPAPPGWQFWTTDAPAGPRTARPPPSGPAAARAEGDPQRGRKPAGLRRHSRELIAGVAVLVLVVAAAAAGYWFLWRSKVPPGAIAVPDAFNITIDSALQTGYVGGGQSKVSIVDLTRRRVTSTVPLADPSLVTPVAKARKLFIPRSESVHQMNQDVWRSAPDGWSPCGACKPLPVCGFGLTRCSSDDMGRCALQSRRPNGLECHAPVLRATTTR
jgi:hypothetical protein